MALLSIVQSSSSSVVVYILYNRGDLDCSVSIVLEFVCCLLLLYNKRQEHDKIDHELFVIPGIIWVIIGQPSHLSSKELGPSFHLYFWRCVRLEVLFVGTVCRWSSVAYIDTKK